MAGVAPNVNAQITRRLAVMEEQLRKAFTATDTRSIKQLKEHIILGKPCWKHGICFWREAEGNGISRSMILYYPEPNDMRMQQKFRVQHVNGKDHLFATERLISDWELLNLILLQIDFPRQFIPEPILAQLEVDHYPYTWYANDDERLNAQLWLEEGVPDDIGNIIALKIDSVENWVDVEELFENANRLRELREWKRGLRQGPPKRNLLLNLPDEGAANLVGTLDKKKRSLLLNLPEGGPANLVGTFVTGARRNGGRRPGLHNLDIADQEQVLIDRLTPNMNDARDVRDVILPVAYHNRGHYLNVISDYYRDRQAWLIQKYGSAVPAAVGPAAAGAVRTRKRKTRNRKTRKNRK